MTYFLFILGFFVLIKGADVLIDGASSIAKRFSISDLVIGMTIVAFGTSAPELVVNIFASAQGNADLAISNVLGSNIANIFLGLGVACLFGGLVVQRNTVIKEIPLSFLAAVVLAFLVNDQLIDHGAVSQLTRIDGLILLSFFAVFFFYTISLAMVGKEKLQVETEFMPIGKALLFSVLGLAGLVFGGDWIVAGAVLLAQNFGMSESLIGLTIVAVGTSLPEIVTSAVSAKKGKKDIAIGNVVGSNMFNIFWVLGISSVIKPLPFQSSLNLDVITHIVAAALLFLFVFVANKNHILKRWHGFLFLALYAVYMAVAIYRG